ncbi:NAD-dependent succinate-semialdehyde dehydrogenase [Amycolatopsis thermophila]|uniref:Succinate-semialdehyde dehydrogenase/glutarate-semialdehyde dehydrogenase n=1 Tax=Amycolatopsis thermophila TaxID=206084 RepID=A0ABU0F170_9PSEU|nr:NAD-dependent succinate-semialdehyde dehydrogenase [Amycolatopsis thermophila]MDQ0381320.1 succinate-semialdehyde dehydrogenase/glutarate-semialdehyde dehydrogenase [Amycolatopsis thermophila]
MTGYHTTNPATGELVKEFPLASDQDVEQALDRAHSAYRRWRDAPLEQRAGLLRRVARLHRERADELAAILTLEMGKPITQARGEVALVAAIYDYYADHAARFLAEEKLDIAGSGEAVLRTEPIGALVGIMPWNFPYYQVARFAAPNLVLGNTILLKHARNCPQAALAIEDLFTEAGAPEGTYLNLFADSAQIARLIGDPRVQGVSLTGSERAGSAVGEVTGRHMKKYVLELGGSDPFIVLDDTDLEATVAQAVHNRLFNAGQACTASKRFIVLAEVHDAFLERFVRAMREVRPADPTDPATRLGPLASRDVVDDLAEQVEDAVAKGAILHTGGRRVPGPGSFYEPTVLTGVTPGMRAYAEELFGPVAVVHRVASEREAVALANESPFGLAASVYTADVERARALARDLECGMVWINGTSRSAPDLPFGGVKRSGVGRELGELGITEFANKKLVRIP